MLESGVNYLSALLRKLGLMPLHKKDAGGQLHSYSLDV